MASFVKFQKESSLSQLLNKWSFLDTSNVYIFLLSVLFVPIAHLILTRTRSYLSFRSAKSKYGCEKPAIYPHKDYFGRDLLDERQQASNAGRQMAHYDHWFETLGNSWEERLFSLRIVNTINGENIKFIMTNEAGDFGRGGKYHKNLVLGPGILASDGLRWKVSRDMIKPIFTKVEVGNTSMLQKHVDRMIEQIPGGGKTIDMQPLIKRMFLDASTEFLFGESANALGSADTSAADSFLADFDYAVAGMLKRRKAGFFSFKYMFDKRYAEAIHSVHRFVDKHVDRALKLSDTGKPEGRHILLYELAKQLKDPVALRFEVLNVFSPSRDTTAILVSNALFRLARAPKIWTELRTTALALGPDPQLTFELLKSLKPFRNVVSETLRTTGPSGRMVRTAFNDTILPRGGGPDGQAPVFIQQGDQVAMFLWGMHHDKTVWGEDSYEFRPDRWEHRPAPKWEFVPFAGGKRICPANQQALVHAICVLVRLTREFESIENRDPVEEYVELQHTLTQSRNGVKVAFRRA